MGLILLINSEKDILTRVRESFQNQDKRFDSTIRMISSPKRIQESLNYDLPELVIINCHDPKVTLKTMSDMIRSENWMHSFGLIGLFDSGQQSEEHIAELMKDLNLLVLLDYNRIRSHLMNCVSIILENWQLIFQHDVSSHFVEAMSGSFMIENDVLSLPLYAGIPVTKLTQMGLISPDNKMLLQLAISELIINAVEHGNCGITYDEKTQAMSEGKSVVELVQERCEDPKVAAKKVLFTWEIHAEHSSFVVRDEGEGFDVQAIREKTSKQDMLQSHGRGISLAENLSQKLQYNEKGNEVNMQIQHAANVAKQTPEGFSNEEIILTQKGTVVFHEGEPGDFLYYISSGSFAVENKGKAVGVMSPADIFMGEMSFLLNNRRSASVIAIDEGKLIKISRKAFVEVLKKYPHYGIVLSKLLARKLVRSNEERAAL